MKILFLVPYPTEGASNRVRVEQFIPYLESRGMRCSVRPFINGRFFRILYLPRRFPEKAFWFVLSTINRFLDILRAVGYDIIFIHREAYPFGGPFMEYILRRMGKPIVFDFDDAIFLPDTSEHNAYLERFKNSGKVADIIKMSSRVIAGNCYLRDYAVRHNKAVDVIPSSVDTGRYMPAPSRPGRDGVVIGWVGSNTTRRYLYDLEDVFAELSRRYRGLVLKIVGAPFYSSKVRGVINKRWSLEEEISDLQSFDIGIMPMPDNGWTRGKCGFKAILYMACALPVVLSPVGANNEIIEDGVDGFFAGDRSEWLDRLGRLIDSVSLRREMGKNGRKKVMQRYSLDMAAPAFYDTLKSVGGARI